jgi:hypothetical protein
MSAAQNDPPVPPPEPANDDGALPDCALALADGHYLAIYRVAAPNLDFYEARVAVLLDANVHFISARSARRFARALGERKSCEFEGLAVRLEDEVWLWSRF